MVPGLGELVLLATLEAPAEPMPGSDADLIRASRSGDRQAFARLVERYSARAFTLAKRLSPDPAAAEDLAQEAFLRVFQALDRFDDARPFFPWFVTILRNLAKNELRRRHPEPQGSADEVAGPLGASAAPGPAQVAQTTDTRRQLLDAIASLPHQYREVVALRFLEDRPVREVAGLLGIPEGTVKTHLFRARELLRRALAQVADGSPT